MDTIIEQIAQRLLDKPILKFANNAISLSDIFYVGIVIFVAYFVYFSVKIFVNMQIKRKKIRGAQGKTLMQLFGYVVTISGLFFAAKVLGYSLSYFLLGSTALLVGLGFGLQQLFVDLVSGVILLIDQNVNLGDVVKVDIPSGRENMYGKVYHIGLRTTLLQTIDNEFHIIPNSKFLSSGVRSLMRDKGAARFRIHVQVDYKTDMELAQKVLMSCVLQDVRVEKEPSPTIIIKEFMDNGIMLEIRFWMKEIFNSEQILSDIRFQIVEEFRKNDIVIPFPQRVMYEKALIK